jgi:hypothetical protein
VFFLFVIGTRRLVKNLFDRTMIRLRMRGGVSLFLVAAIVLSVAKESLSQIVHPLKDGNPLPAGRTLFGPTGPTGPRGPFGSDGIGLHLREFLIGSNFSKGDYVFRRSTKDGHDAMYVAQQNFVAQVEPWDARDQWLELSKGAKGKDGKNGITSVVHHYHIHKAGLPADRTISGPTGPTGPHGPDGSDGIGLHLREFFIGSHFSKGDYVFRRSTKDGHDAMYVAQQNFVAQVEPWDARDQWLELSKGERGAQGAPGRVFGPSGLVNLNTDHIRDVILNKVEAQMASEVKLEVKREVSIFEKSVLDKVANLSIEVKHVQKMPGPPGVKGERGEPGRQGEKGNDGVGLHLQSFKSGTNYTRGDYVFYGSKMYIAQNSFVAKNDPSKEPHNWVMFDAPRGERGATGLQGQDGKSVRGLPGQAGAPGQRGPMGPAGATGLPGVEGKAGVKGEKGNDGVGLHIQTFAIGSHYKKGDYIFYESRMYIAQRTFTASAIPYLAPYDWVVFAAPKGEPGTDGLPGRDGQNGRDGLQGPAGKDGLQGPAGNTGEKGEPGKDGQDGKRGPDGSRGEKGNDGVGCICNLSSPVPITLEATMSSTAVKCTLPKTVSLRKTTHPKNHTIG